jgi:phosphoglycolate phosphatase
MIRRNREIPAERIRLLIFDLDGTLVDSRLDLANSVNATLRHFQRPELPCDVIASYIGDGAPMLVRLALGDPDDTRLIDDALAFFLTYYREHKLDNTTVYAGVKESLIAIRFARNGPGSPASPPLAGRGGGSGRALERTFAVLSNKPVHPSRAIVQALGLAEFFVQVYGGNSFPTKKPDPLGARTLLEEAGAKPEEAMIIGDSDIDVLTGRNAGLWTCGVTYGFAPHSLESVPPDVLVDSPGELAQVFVSTAEARRR